MIEWLAVVLALSAASAPAPADCRPIDGVPPLLKPGRVLLLGELHGTVESPAFALDVACHATASGLPVVVGLELPGTEQARVNRYLGSQGSTQDREELLAGPIWQAEYQDGRASNAMLGLIDGLRKLRGASAAVRILLFDAPSSGGNQQRDRAMGNTVAAAARESPGAMLVVLTGNMHSRTTKGRPRNADYEPLGHVVAREVTAERLVALNVAHGGGDAWLCNPRCGVKTVNGRRGGRGWTIEIDESTRPAGHHGWYYVGKLTAALPARIAPVSQPLQSAVGEENAAAVPQVARASGTDAAHTAPDTPLSEPETKLQGTWQAHDYESDARTWKMTFEGRRFLADAGPDDWYRGRIALHPTSKPTGIDFTIDDCRCDLKGTTSKGILAWEGDALVIAAPQPGKPRAKTFRPSRGDMLRLRPLQSAGEVAPH